jgi:hypothetical protein
MGALDRRGLATAGCEACARVEGRQAAEGEREPERQALPAPAAVDSAVPAAVGRSHPPVLGVDEVDGAANGPGSLPRRGDEPPIATVRGGSHHATTHREREAEPRRHEVESCRPLTRSRRRATSGRRRRFAAAAGRRSSDSRPTTSGTRSCSAPVARRHPRPAPRFSRARGSRARRLGRDDRHRHGKCRPHAADRPHITFGQRPDPS